MSALAPVERRFERPSVGRLVPPKAPAVLESELTGGGHALVVRRPGLPLVELRLAFPLAEHEIAQPAAGEVLAESLFAGTDRHDRASLAEAIERLGASLSAHHDRDRFVVSASVLAENLQPLLELLAEILTGAAYPTAEVRADRSRRADEAAIALSQPAVIAAEALRRRLFPGHPYATGLARPNVLRRVGPEDLRALDRALLTPRAAHLVLAGELQTGRALSLAEAALGAWLSSRRPRRGARLAGIPTVPPGGIDLVERKDAVQSNLRLAASAPRVSSPDWPPAALADVALGGMFSSRLVANLRENHGYTYSPRSNVNHLRAGSFSVLAADVATAVTAAALVEIRYELGRLATTGIAEDELEMARRYAVGRFGLQTSSLGGLASTLAFLAVDGVGPGYLASYPAALARATKAEVDEAARRYLAPHRMVTVVVGDAGEVVDSLSDLDDVVVRKS